MSPAIVSHDNDVDWLSPSSCNALCDETQKKWRSVQEELQHTRDKLKHTQKQYVMQELMRMMKDAKKLSVKEFDEKFGCDIIGIVKAQFPDGVMTVSGVKRNRNISEITATSNGLSFKTPSHKLRIPTTAVTRTARKGERVMTYSVNGSPLEQFDHGEVVITAKKRHVGKGVAPFPVSIGIGAGNGGCLDLFDPSQRKQLDEQQKAQAMQQLMAMQEQMKNLMADW